MPKHTLHVALAAALTAGVIAQPQQVRTQEMVPRIVPHDELVAKGLSAESDEDFIKHAVRAGAIEIQAGKLAMTRTIQADVRAFAETLVKDHTAAAKELAQWATKKNVVLKDDDPDVKMKLDKHRWLETKFGADFNKQFVEAMFTDHVDVVMLFVHGANNTKDPALKKFADETRQATLGHLRMAMDLKKKLF